MTTTALPPTAAGAVRRGAPGVRHHPVDPTTLLSTWVATQGTNLSRHAASLRAFAPDEFGSGPSAPSAAHIAAVNGFVGGLRARLLESSRWMDAAVVTARRAPTRPALEAVLDRKTRVSAQVLYVEGIWDFYFDLFVQRLSTFGERLRTVDRIAANCYEAVYSGLGSAARPVPALLPFSYADSGFSPSTFRRGVPLAKLRHHPNLFPLIALPQHRLSNVWALSSVLHEVSHNLQADLGLWEVMPRLLHRRITSDAGLPDEVGQVWARWHKELTADLFALLLGGPSAVESLMDVVGRSRAATVHFDPQGVHPTPYLRVLLSLVLLRRMGFGPLADGLEEAWRRLYPDVGPDQVPRIVLQTFPRAAACAVDTVCFQPHRQLGGRPLVQVLRYGPKEQAGVESAATRLAAGQDPGATPLRFMVSAARHAFDHRLAPPEAITENFYRTLGEALTMSAESENKTGADSGTDNGHVTTPDLSAVSEALQELASTARSRLSTASPVSDGDGDGLGARIAARRAQIVGARGEVPPERLRAALSRRSPAVGLPAGTALLPSRQRLLAHQVAPAVDAASAILAALRPLRPGAVDQAEVEAVVRSLGAVLSALRREAVEPEPREELVDAKRRALLGPSEEQAQHDHSTAPKGLLRRLQRLMQDRDDRHSPFDSAEDVEQGNQLELLGVNVVRVLGAFETFFSADAERPLPAVDRVPDVQAQLRVVADSAADLRTRLHAAGADDAELAAPDGRLDRVGRYLPGATTELPRMTMARLLGWIADLSEGASAADLPVTGSIGLTSVAVEAVALRDAVAALAGAGDGDVASASNGRRATSSGPAAGRGAVGTALLDARVHEALEVLASQLDTVASVADPSSSDDTEQGRGPAPGPDGGPPDAGRAPRPKVPRPTQGEDAKTGVKS